MSDEPIEPTPAMINAMDAVHVLLPKLVCMYVDDPKMAELDSFLIAGRDKNGDVHVACWELTVDMVNALLKDMTNIERECLNEPRRSQ